MRADGYHELRTVFQALSLHDVIDCISRPGPFAIECDTAGIPLDRSNLIWQAAQALWGASAPVGGAPGQLAPRAQRRTPPAGPARGGVECAGRPLPAGRR